MAPSLPRGRMPVTVEAIRKRIVALKAAADHEEGLRLVEEAIDKYKLSRADILAIAKAMKPRHRFKIKRKKQGPLDVPSQDQPSEEEQQVALPSG